LTVTNRSDGPARTILLNTVIPLAAILVLCDR
jgi:hypothetical protein